MDLAWLKSNLDNVRQGLAAEVNKFKNKSMLEAIVAGCALVAHADGSVSSEEKQKMMGYLRSSETLKVYDSGEVIQIFQKYAEKFAFDVQIGSGEVMTAIGKFRGKPEAQLIVRVCCAISAADGAFDDKEKAVVRRMCQELGLDPQVFDL